MQIILQERDHFWRWLRIISGRSFLSFGLLIAGSAAGFFSYELPPGFSTDSSKEIILVYYCKMAALP